MNPAISVIVPVYNTEKYLHQCIDSICNQTLQDIEILLVDDASTDNSLSILEAYAKKDCRVKVVQNHHEGDGSASARNHGLRLAKGKYISFLDSDDHFELTMLEKAYLHAEMHRTDITMYDGVFFHDQTNEMLHTALYHKACLPQKEVFQADDFPERVFFQTTSFEWLSLFRREFVMEQGLYFQAVHHYDDTLFVRSAYVLAKRISLIPEIFVYHRTDNAGSQSFHSEKNPTGILEASLAIKQFLEEKGVFESVRNGHAMHAIYACKNLLDGYPTHVAFSQLFEALKTEYIEKLGLVESITENLLPYDAMEWIEKIKNGSQASYIFELKEKQKRELFYFGTNVIFPHTQIKKDENVILYGAGAIGTGFYLQNMKYKYCNLVAWVDKNPEGKQIPIQGLDVLNTAACDKIVVAIDSESIYADVCQYLMGIGFAKEQIVYGMQS